MTYSSIIENESQRLSALNDYKLINNNEINFEDVTLIASQLCEAPMAAVTLIDKDTAWYKSPLGFKSTMCPREDVFCNHTIHQTDIFEIPDTHEVRHLLEDDKVIDELNVRFYAGIGLIDKSGFALGTLCVMDHIPRQLKREQLQSLKVLARQTMNMIELKHSKEKLNHQYSELQRLTRLTAVQQERMVQSARLSSLGEMANGVAHEINNPLSVIDHAVEKMNRSHRYEPQSFFAIQKSIQRIARIISSLRNYGRNGERDPLEQVNLCNILKSTMDLYASRAQEEGIILKVECDDSHVIESRETCLSQITMNLVQNAFQAVQKVKDKWITVRSYFKDNQAVIEVIDSGAGIDPSLRDRIFDPFFTTKNSTEGSGLGLSVAKKLAADNGGSLFLDATSPHTKFVLKLNKEAKKSFLERSTVSLTRPRLAS